MIYHVPQLRSKRVNMHPLDHFKFCPVCGSSHFVENNEKSKRCENCGFIYYANPSSATVALIENEKGELLVVRRKNDPGKGTLDLPGGFVDMDETGEAGMIREVKEETGLDVTHVDYLFSIPNLYRYSGMDIHTLDMFYRCQVRDLSVVHAADDAAGYLWIPKAEIKTEQFGLCSVRQGLHQYLGR